MEGKTHPDRTACRNDGDSSEHEQRLEQLLARLPSRLQSITRWLRRPASRWIRVPAALLLIGGAALSILPFFGLWMLPLGLLLLAEDLPPLRRLRNRALRWIAHRRPHWFAGEQTGAKRPPGTRPLPIDSA